VKLIRVRWRPAGRSSPVLLTASFYRLTIIIRKRGVRSTSSAATGRSPSREHFDVEGGPLHVTTFPPTDLALLQERTSHSDSRPHGSRRPPGDASSH